MIMLFEAVYNWGGYKKHHIHDNHPILQIQKADAGDIDIMLLIIESMSHVVATVVNDRSSLSSYRPESEHLKWALQILGSGVSNNQSLKYTLAATMFNEYSGVSVCIFTFEKM